VLDDEIKEAPMKKLLALLVLTPALASAAGGPATARVKLETSKGVIVLELDAAKSPITVSNFLAYVKSGFYDGTIIHRVIPGFMIQGGGFTPKMDEKPTSGTIVNEAANGLSNLRGTVAMARTPDPNSASAQFFVNLVNNTFLDRAKAPDGFGYCVFGKVIEGMNVVDAIASVPTGAVGQYQNVPSQPVTIQKASVLTGAKTMSAKRPAAPAPGQPQPR